MDEGEGLDAAAGRELQEETSVDPASVLLTQVRQRGAHAQPCHAPGVVRRATKYRNLEQIRVNDGAWRAPAQLCHRGVLVQQCGA